MPQFKSETFTPVDEFNVHRDASFLTNSRSTLAFLSEIGTVVYEVNERNLVRLELEWDVGVIYYPLHLWTFRIFEFACMKCLSLTRELVAHPSVETNSFES